MLIRYNFGINVIFGNFAALFWNAKHGKFKRPKITPFRPKKHRAYFAPKP